MKIKFRALCLTALVAVLAFASTAVALPKYIVTDAPGNAYIMSLNEDKTFTSKDMSVAGSLNDAHLYALADYKYILAISNGSIGVFTANGTDTPAWTKSAATDIAIPKMAAADVNGNLGLIYAPTNKVNTGEVSSDSFLKVSVGDDGKLSTTGLPFSGTLEINAKLLTAWDNFFVVVSNDGNGGTPVTAEHMTNGYVFNMVEFPFSTTNLSPDLSLGTSTLYLHSTDVAATFEVVQADGATINASGVSDDRTYLSVASGDWAYLSTGYALYTFKKPSFSLNEQVGLQIAKVYTGHLLGLQIDDENQPIAVVSTDVDGTETNVQLDLMRFDAPASNGTFNSTNFRTRMIRNDITTLGDGSTRTGIGDVTIAYDNDSGYVTVINAAKDGTAEMRGRLVIYEPVANTWGIVASTDIESTAVAAQIASTGSGSDGKGDGSTTTVTVVDPTSLTDDQKASLKEATGGDAADFVTTATEATGTTPDSTVTANVRSAAGTGYEDATVAAVKNYTLASDGYILVKAAGYNAANVKVFFVPVSTSSATVAADSTSEGVLLDSSYAKITSGTSAFASSAEKLTAGTYTLVTATKTASTTPEDEGSTTSSSSGGCDAGLGLWAAAALMAVSTLSKRR